MRRVITLIVLGAMVAAPQLSSALPRPAGGTDVPQKSLVLWPGNAQSATLDGANSVGISSPVLTQGRQYQLEVSGTWKPSASASNLADAAFETTDGTNWSHTGRGLLIGSTNFGAVTSPLSYRSNHVYFINWTGRGIGETLRLNDNTAYTDNSGAVTIKIWQIQRVTWNYRISQPITIGIPATPPISVDARPVNVQQEVDSVEVPGASLQVPVPQLGYIEFYSPGSGTGVGCPDGFSRAKMKLVANGGTIADQDLGCYGSTVVYKQNIGGPIPEQPFIVSPFRFPCPEPKCMVGFKGENQPVWGGTGAIDVVPAGTTVDVDLSWEADITRLWQTFLDDGSGQNTYVAPFNAINANERAWYLGELAAQRLALKITVTLYGPGRTPIYSTGNAIPPIPGMGQILESVFYTKVGGF